MTAPAPNVADGLTLPTTLVAEAMTPRTHRLALALAAASCFLMVGCGGGGGGSAPPVAAAPAPASPPPPPPVNAAIAVLMIGNSHTSTNDLPNALAALVRTGRPGRTVAVTVSPGSMFLEEHLDYAPTTTLLASRRWSFVILQAQKYSTSGQIFYPTSQAEEFIRRARGQGAVPVMFPEWPRRDVNETQRIYDLHVYIAQREPACVAPIGQAWDWALARYPTLALHDADGNHSSPAGAYLTALVLYATLTGGAPSALPDLPLAGVSAETQGRLRGIASETVAAIAPRTDCPNDPY